ncbi:hypothetical protein VIBNIAM115_760002 [Vibrio nigripulchritudo AM115]|nr:hypothetical protein VIBNIAM115_760002 [Vibrio nigripulchritudo AM115]
MDIAVLSAIHLNLAAKVESIFPVCDIQKLMSSHFLFLHTQCVST